MPEAKYIDTEALSAYTEALSKKLSRVYSTKGSAIYADTSYLASADKASPAIDSVGLWQQVDGNWVQITEFRATWVYNITNAFTTDSNFIDGGGNKIAAGNNIAVVNVGTDQNPVLKFDLLALGIDLEDINAALAQLPDKQTKTLSTDNRIVLPDVTVADATAREALTSADVADRDIVYQTDTQEYYYVQVDTNIVTLYDIGNTKTVEGMLKLIGSLMPVKPISTAEIQAMFA